MTTEKKNSKRPKCGIVMPISAIDGCTIEHWVDVLNIIKESIEVADFDSNLVSDSDDSGIIQKRIIQNLYSNDIIICDVSGKNPNVMFELGMRLAFDKPTIIIKDDITDYSFDTSIIEHLTYPRDLRFNKIVEFKIALKNKIIGTHNKATTDPKYTTFLKNFGEYKVAQLIENEVTSDKFILNAIEEMRNEMSMMRRGQVFNENFLSSNTNINKIKIERARRIIDLKIQNFLSQNNLKYIDVFNQDQKNQLFDYLESIEEIREYCGSPQLLRKITEELLPPF